MDIQSTLSTLLLIAWLLPLASFTVICLSYSLANLFGKEVGEAGKGGGYIATGAIVISCGLSLIAMAVWLSNHPLPAPHHLHAAHGDAGHGEGHGDEGHHEERPAGAHEGDSHEAEDDKHTSLPVKASFASYAVGSPAANEDEHATSHASGSDGGEGTAAGADPHAGHHDKPAYFGDWYALGIFGDLKITIGYYIDTLTVAMFCMVTFIASCIHFYAIGYMHDELHEFVDHEVTLADGHHLHRPGRFHRFFQYLSLFCFSMLGIVIAGNIAMVFVFWELVGICSYFLIGFYIERKSASNAANKAFIVNRVGDFGMIIGLMALFGALGTFNFGGEDGIFAQVRPAMVSGQPNHHQLVVPDGMILAEKREEVGRVVRDHVALHGQQMDEYDRLQLAPKMAEWREGGVGYWLLVVAGLGIFCGCIGKSAQFPLHVWLPDAMEGPTPVSALVHSATMVAAGVYLVGRFYPVFTPEVLLTIAYIGCITLFIAATIALTAVDIKRVLAYSTVSQLGYMMLALGVGGWAAGMFHLFTHAFFKSLLFMCSGSVIHAVHTNDMNEMGGLRKKMPYTAYTMLVGCLAIIGAGIPFSVFGIMIGTSGFYSKDAILEQAMLFTQGLDSKGFHFAGNGIHSILYYAVAGGAALTAFYMFRMWYMTFAGEPRNHHRYDHAHESPKIMYVPLVILAVMAVIAGWNLPDKEWLGSLRNFGLPGILAQAQPDGTLRELAGMPNPEVGRLLPDLAIPPESLSHEEAIKVPATLMAFSTAMAGLLMATVIYGLRLLDPNEIKQQFRGVYRFLWNKWYFDELYNFLFVQPTHFVARRVAQFDKVVIDGFIDGIALVTRWISCLWDRWVDRGLLDGVLINGSAARIWGLGLGLRSLQTGSLRQYVMFIVLGTIVLFMLISFVWTWDTAVAG